MNIQKIIWHQQIFRIAVNMALLLCFLLVSIANGEERRDENTYDGWTPLQLSIWTPVQLFGEKRDIYGLRTSIFNGKNRDIYGLALDVFTGGARNIYGFQIQGLEILSTMDSETIKLQVKLVVLPDANWDRLCGIACHLSYSLCK